MKNLFIVALLSVFLVSCGSSGDGAGTDSNGIVSAAFTDSTVSRLEQTSGIAKSNAEKIMNIIIPTAYAGGGTISCISGEQIGIEMDINLGAGSETLNITSTCSNQITVDIRRAMLNAFNGKILIREVSQAGTGVNYQMDFTGGFSFNSPYRVLEGSKTNGVTRNCYLDYTFDYTTGYVYTDTKDNRVGGALATNEAANDDFSVANPHDGSSGCFSENTEFGKVQFRFKDGKVELDESGTGNFSDKGCAQWTGDTLTDYKENGDGSGNCPDAGYESTYERFCVDNNTDGTCDV